MQFERGRAARYHFGAIAEVTDRTSQESLAELTRHLSFRRVKSDYKPRLFTDPASNTMPSVTRKLFCMSP